MRIIKWILGIVVLLAVVFVVVGMILPREVSIARTIEIDAPASQVFPHVNSMQATQEWSPWLSRDPETKLTYTGPETGVGNTLEWASDHPQLDFGDMGLAKAEFLLDEAAGKTTVTWTLDTDMGAGPVGRWMGLMMDRWVGGDYEAGLANLKKLVEG